MFKILVCCVVLLLPRPAQTFSQEIFLVEDAVLKICDEREIPCLSSGVVTDSFIREGSIVKAGQLVMVVNDELAKMDLAKLEKELVMAKEKAATTVDINYADRTIEVAKAELERALRANTRSPGAVADTELDQLKLVVEKSIAEKKKTQFELDQRESLSQIRQLEVSIGRKKLVDHNMISPIDGMIVEVFKKKGEWVDVSSSVARIVRLDKLKTEVKVPAAIALEGIIGKEAVFIPKLEPLKHKTYRAKVVFAHPEVNPVNASVRVSVEVENDDYDLVAGLIGRLEIKRNSTTTSDSEANGKVELTQDCP